MHRSRVCVLAVLAFVVASCARPDAQQTTTAPTSSTAPSTVATSPTVQTTAATTTTPPVASASASSESALGNMFGDTLDDDGGLGLSDVGYADAGEGIGLGNFSGFETSSGRSSNDAGSTATGASVTVGGASINGRLPPDVIQRIVRQHLNQVRACFTGALLKTPTLAGRVNVIFTIGRNGAVVFAADAGSSDLADTDAINCIVGAFRTIVFPPPEGGTVTVTYPLVFKPGQ
jgi:hypothetical protein